MDLDNGISVETVHAKNEITFNPKHQKRLFDRRSGTGRGKEIAKGGAGGKYTWGNNSKELALEYTKHYDISEVEATGDCKKINKFRL